MDQERVHVGGVVAYVEFFGEIFRTQLSLAGSKRLGIQQRVDAGRQPVRIQHVAIVQPPVVAEIQRDPQAVQNGAQTFLFTGISFAELFAFVAELVERQKVLLSRCRRSA